MNCAEHNLTMFMCYQVTCVMDTQVLRGSLCTETG